MLKASAVAYGLKKKTHCKSVCIMKEWSIDGLFSSIIGYPGNCTPHPNGIIK
jgi:hypothetical protein